jgi:hypothetical protein
MADVPHWHLKGDWFDVCKCTIPCPCTFAQAPSEGDCEGILAWHIREGNYGDVSLDGLNVLMLGSFEGNIWTGEAKNSVAAFFVDERADASQHEALRTIFLGEAGGWPASFADLMEEVRGFEPAPSSSRSPTTSHGGEPKFRAGWRRAPRRSPARPLRRERVCSSAQSARRRGRSRSDRDWGCRDR